MERPAQKIESLFQEKVMLYKDLVDILNQEKRTLMETNVDALWKISEQKQKVASRIENIRHSILSTLLEMGIEHEMSVAAFNIPAVIEYLSEAVEDSRDLTESLRKINVTLVTLKNQVQELASDNKRFVEEYLDVLDELISIIASAGKPEKSYSRYPSTSMKANMFLHRQV